MKGIRVKAKEVFAKSYIKTLLVFAFFFIGLLVLYFSIKNVSGLDDAFFHIRLAQLIRQDGWATLFHFPWINFSYVAQGDVYLVYYSFLFHFLIIPFTWIDPLVVGLKLYATLLAALGLTLLYMAFKQFNVQQPWFWTLISLALMGPTFFFRLTLGRPFVLAPALFLTLLWLLYKNHRWGATILCFLYTFWHSPTFFFPPVIILGYGLVQKFNHQKINWRLLLTALSGTIMSLIALLIISPGFGQFLTSLLGGVIFQTVLRNKVPLPEGGEVYPMDFFSLLQQQSILIPLLLLAFSFEIAAYVKGRQKREFSSQPVLRQTLFGLSLVFMLGTYLVLKNGDLFIFFSLTYLAVVWQELSSKIVIADRWIKRAIIVGLIIAVTYLAGDKLLTFQSAIASEEYYGSIEPAASWLAKYTPDKSIVFNTNWSDFTRLFYYDQRNYYIAGLEPRFLYDYNRRLYWLWWHISVNGYACGEQNCPGQSRRREQARLNLDLRRQWYATEGQEVANTLVNDFKSRYVITSSSYYALIDLMDNSPEFKLVFNGDAQGYKVYEVTNPKN